MVVIWILTKRLLGYVHIYIEIYMYLYMHIQNMYMYIYIYICILIYYIGGVWTKALVGP